MGREKFNRPVNADLIMEPVTTASTAVNIGAFGHFKVSNATSGGVRVINIDDPVNGGVVAISVATLSTSTATDSIQVKSTGATFDGSNNVATFNAASDGLMLVGQSTSRYGVVGLSSVTFSTTT